MGSVVLEFCTSVAVIIVAGTVLARSADAIAALTGWGRLLVGSVMLAGATSLPELMIGLNALALDLPDIAVGDLIGSSLFNLLILAAADLFHRSRGALLSPTVAGHALSGTVTIVVTALAAAAILIEQQVVWGISLPLGPGTAAILVAYLFGIRLVFHDQQISGTSLAKEEADPPRARRVPAAWWPVVCYLGGAAVIFATAPFLTRSAGTIAEQTGLGGTFVGTCLVALATSLPELVATWTALRIGAFDLAIGNIFGSNAFNVLLLVPMDLAYGGSLLAAVSQTHVLTCLAVIVVTSVVILGQLYRVEKRVVFLEPDACLVIVMVFVALGLIYVAG